MRGRTIREETRSLIQAYEIESFARTKRLPDLDRLLKRVRRMSGDKPKDQSAAVAAMLDRRIARQQRKNRKARDRAAAHQPCPARGNRNKGD